MVEHLLAGLNPVQQEIVKDTEGQLLVLAGAGSGKTRVLTHRIAYLLEQGVPPWQILAVTFTNKAAREMRERIVTLAGTGARDVWMGTFHGICIRILGRFGPEIGIDKFTIIDDADQKKILKEVIETVGGDYELDVVKSVISDAKNDLQTPGLLLENATYQHERDLAHMYQAYEDKKTECNYLDFDDCIMKVVHLFNVSEVARNQYQHQFRYVLTDETQDTNKAQFKLLTQLAAHHENIFVVGDADQCQPPETIVSTPSGDKRIDELQTGDEVLAWNRNAQYTTGVGYPIEVASRHYQGTMFTISADAKQTRATPNHKFLVRWSNRAQNKWVTYLMYRKDRGYRVGWCQLFKSDGSFHLGTRARLEKAEKTWILKTHDSKQEATVYESITSMRYGIPLAMFEPNNELYTEEVTSAIFAGANPDGGMFCLQDHDKYFDYPFYPYPTAKIGRPSYFECYASNLIAELMMIPLPGDKNNRNLWVPIWNVTYAPYNGPVYSLDVAEHHNYVADGLVTLNSIYKFRGADISNIMNFQSYYPMSKLYKLEQNYRSTANIVTASNSLIGNNTERLEKTAFTDKESGNPVVVYQADDDGREADFIAKVIKRMHEVEGRPLSEFAVLYRMGRQSRSLESAFNHERLRYEIVGGTNFYDRKEIKDLVSYLRAVNNQVDALAFKRIINVPKRGVGDTSVGRIEDFASEYNIPFAKALENLDDIPKMPKKAAASIKDFLGIMERLNAFAASPEFTSAEMVNLILRETGYKESLNPDKEEDMGRLENIEELVNVAGKWDQDPENEDKTLLDFLNETALVSDLDSLEAEDKVTMMTAHSSKGLEYPVVFIAGVEEGIFPHGRSLGDPTELEEERRLMYVAMTRAEEKLFITHCKQRYEYGNPRPIYNKPSRFLRELPAELVKKI